MTVTYCVAYIDYYAPVLPMVLEVLTQGGVVSRATPLNHKERGVW